LQIKTKIVSCHTADSKPVKQEVNGTVILPPLVFLGSIDRTDRGARYLTRENLKVVWAGFSTLNYAVLLNRNMSR
jgi:hypothetical protein